MKIITTKSNLVFKSKEEKEFRKILKEDMGKSKLMRFWICYVQGIKEIDESGKFKDPLTLMLSIYKHKKGISLKIENGGIKSWILALPSNEIKKIYFVDGEIISKQKSVMGRGVVGAVLAGPTGAVIGGLSGLGKVEYQKSFIVIETIETKIILKYGIRDKEKIERDFKNMFGNKVITTLDLKLKQEQEKLNNL